MHIILYLYLFAFIATFNMIITYIILSNRTISYKVLLLINILMNKSKKKCIFILPG